MDSSRKKKVPVRASFLIFMVKVFFPNPGDNKKGHALSRA
jgi:hypothetical protein